MAAVCGNLGLALRLNLENTRLNVTSLTLHFELPIVRTAALQALEAIPLRKIFEVSGSAKSKNVPSIAGSSRVEMDVVICQERVLWKQNDAAMPMDA